MKPLVLALLLVALPACSAETPASAPSTLTSQVNSNAGSFQLLWDPAAQSPPLNEEYDLHFALRTPAGAPLDLPSADLHLDARMPRHGHGMNQDPLIKRTAAGCYTAHGLRLHMTGHWEIYLDVRLGALTERAEFTLELW